MFYKERGDESAYTVLEISPSATDDEVKAAFRRMAMKYHPDRVASLGPDVQKSATEKFRQVQEAYETIKKQRGMK
jgi:DnaJ like chaperone protein